MEKDFSQVKKIVPLGLVASTWLRSFLPKLRCELGELTASAAKLIKLIKPLVPVEMRFKIYSDGGGAQIATVSDPPKAVLLLCPIFFKYGLTPVSYSFIWSSCGKIISSQQD